jgi:hypothetical protein
MFQSTVSRRNQILLCLALLLLAALAIVLAPKAARADDGTPIKGTFTAAFSVMPIPVGDSLCGGAQPCNKVEAHGAGYSTLGALSLSLQKTIVGPALHGSITLTAPNGDTLSAIYDGTQDAPNTNNFRNAVGTLTFTDGTGRFEGVSGTANFTAVFSRIVGTANPIQGIAFYSVEGTLSLPNGDQ